VTSIGELLEPDTRRRLLARLRELDEIDRIIRQPGRTRPPEPPRPVGAATKEAHHHEHLAL
jgi:hypothetical protein